MRYRLGKRGARAPLLQGTTAYFANEANRRMCFEKRRHTSLNSISILYQHVFAQKSLPVRNIFYKFIGTSRLLFRKTNELIEEKRYNSSDTLRGTFNLETGKFKCEFEEMVNGRY